MNVRETPVKAGGVQKSTVSYRGVAGYIDACDGATISGWAQIPYMPLIPAVLDVSIDGTSVGTVKANGFRQDLRDKKIRDGFAAFSFTVPLRFHDGAAHHFTVTERTSKKQL